MKQMFLLISHYSKGFLLYLLCSLWIVSFSSCDEVGKRDLKKAVDANLHEGKLKGYSSVYIIDVYNGTYEYDDNPDEPLLQYPIYKHSDGSYTIEYSDGEYDLIELEEPLDLFGTGLTLLKWKFDYNHFIEDIPRSY